VSRHDGYTCYERHILIKGIWELKCTFYIVSVVILVTILMIRISRPKPLPAAVVGSAAISSHGAATPGEYARDRSDCEARRLVGMTVSLPGPDPVTSVKSLLAAQRDRR